MICEAKTKALISFAVSFTVTAKLVCTFVFAYAECWFSHDGPYLYMHYTLNIVHKLNGVRISKIIVLIIS